MIEAGGRVGGDVSRIDVDLGGAAPFVGALAWWLAVSVSTLLLGLLALWIAPRAADAVREQMRDGGWGPAAGVGLALMICLPLLALLAFVTLLGIPFAIGLLFALVPLAALGYVTACWVLGRALVDVPAHRRATAFLAGWAILRGVALIPLFGAIVFLVAAMLGLGALAARCGRRAARTPAGPEMPRHDGRLTHPHVQRARRDAPISGSCRPPCRTDRSAQPHAPRGRLRAAPANGARASRAASTSASSSRSSPSAPTSCCCRAGGCRTGAARSICSRWAPAASPSSTRCC